MKVMIKAKFFIEPDGDGFHGYCPALKGLHVAGDTEDEVEQFACEAAGAYIRSLIKHDEPIPVGCDTTIYMGFPGNAERGVFGLIS